MFRAAGQNSLLDQQYFVCSLLLPFSCSVWVAGDALISFARIYLSVREAGSTFVECLSSDLGQLERFFSSLFCGVGGSVTHREPQGGFSC